MTDLDHSVPKLSSETDFVERLIETTRAIVLFMDREGRIVLFNDYMRDLCGYELDEVRGQDWFELFIPEPERARLRALYVAALDDVGIRAILSPIVTRSGELRRVEWWGNAVHADDGTVIGLVSVGHDIDEKLELRARLAEAERLANIGLMASVFAHEVGNPLNSISLQLQLLQRRIDRPDRGPLAAKVDVILKEVRRLNMLLEDFRAYRDPATVPLEPTDLAAVVREVSELLSARADEHAVALDCEIVEPLPPVLGNADKLKQVLINLCKNGLEAMSEGGTLAVRAQTIDSLVHVDIVDQGPGIPDNIDVFAPFSTTKASGMGLGLPLAREIIHAHAGELSYKSELGRGTTFTLTLPGVA